jgi:ferredoxin-type protein NapH
LAKRTLIQILTAFLYNGNLPGFLNGRIWQGPSKSICVPGLNCYSCPGALGACPLGALQSSLSGVLLRFPFYVLGLMLLFGLLFGRTVCGWLCPFGFIQELLYKIPSPKFTKNKAKLFFSHSYGVSMNENTKQPAVPFYQVCRLSAVIIPSQSPMELS